MRKFKNTLFVTVLTVFALLSFTSCEEDYYWAEGTLDYSTDFTVSPSGTLYGKDVIDISWVITRSAGRYPEIHDLTFLVGQIDIYVEGGSMGWLDLRIGGTNEVLPFDELSFNSHTTDKSQAAQRFLAIMTEEIRRYGSVEIVVEGEGRPRTKVGIDFGMDLDVYIRD